MEREYVVSLHRFEDLDSFYEDMETPGGNLYIPARAVCPCALRPTSRNTHYMLTEEEAKEIRQDPRVLAVSLTNEELGISIEPDWIQSSPSWNRGQFPLDSEDVQWGLLRSYLGTQTPPGWGQSVFRVDGEVHKTLTGKHVDVVIFDTSVDNRHPEFAKNSDGTGGSRFVKYDWYQHLPVLGGPAGVSYSYNGPYDIHGTHVAGTAAGNRQGWARDSNIYHIRTSSAYGSISTFDMVRQWHITKPINPETGRRNPTVTGHSYGTRISVQINDISALNYRGTTYTGPFTSNQLTEYGLKNNGSSTFLLFQNTADVVDVVDAIDSGIIVVGSAGNYIINLLTPGHVDYDNYVIVNIGNVNYIFYYNRGQWPGCSANVICVGAVDSSLTPAQQERKAGYSNRGTRVDIFAPGSTVFSSLPKDYFSGVSDPRDPSFKLVTLSGTSMSTPQVVGVLACLAERWPTMTQDQAREYLIQNSKVNQITDGGGGFNDDYDLQGAPNRYLYAPTDRLITGNSYPIVSQGVRPASGVQWPRQKIYRYGR
jgi:subtilisin family serine protease